MSILKKILIAIPALLLALLLAFGLSIVYNRMLEPPQVVANVVDIEKVEEISYYRSCAGHTVVPQDMREMRRNMKHYFRVYPEYKEESVVELYAPYDGTVAIIRQDMAELLEGELWIAQDRGLLSFLPPFGLWMVSYEHMRPRADLGYGDRVKAGEVIGYASFLITERDATFDVIYGKVGMPPATIDNWNSPFSDLDTFFNHLSDEVLAEYAARGITPDSIILSKGERDENPCMYRDDGPYFINDHDPADWMKLQ